MILVTGATGLLGCHLIYYLIKSNNKIKIKASYRSIDKIKEFDFVFNYLNKIENLDLSSKNIHWYKCDLLNIHELSTLFEDVSHVYHCAAKVSFYKKDYNECYKQNTTVTRNVVNLCLKENILKLCYVSSTAALGHNHIGLTSEKDKWYHTKYTSGYSISKYKAEMEVWRGINEGLSAVIINPCVILGSGNWENSSLKIFKTVSKGLKFYPPGSNAVVDARDVAKSMIILMKSNCSWQRYLCIGQNIKHRDLFNKIASNLNVSKPKYRLPFSIAKLGAAFLEGFQIFKQNKTGISREMVLSSYKDISYNDEKLKNVVDFKFYTLEETLNFCINGRFKNK